MIARFLHALFLESKTNDQGKQHGRGLVIDASGRCSYGEWIENDEIKSRESICLRSNLMLFRISSIISTDEKDITALEDEIRKHFEQV